ncbi:unnamed protein product [Rhizophagus irregularis]|nr:unnamed protein product [Rhizophagus irregularis]
MCESVLYRCEKLEINDAFEFNEDQLDQVMLNEDESSDQKDEVINITEDYYDFRQAYLNALLNSISRESIDEIWRIVPYIAPNSYQHIIILNDDDDENNLDDLILSYIAKRVEEREARYQLTTTNEIQPSNNTIKSKDGRVYNVSDIKDSTVRRGKGRPPTKRLKAFNEVHNKVGSTSIS